MMNDQLTFETIKSARHQKRKTHRHYGLSQRDRCSSHSSHCHFVQTEQPGDSIIEQVPQAFRNALDNSLTAFSQQLASEASQDETRQCQKPFPSHEFIGCCCGQKPLGKPHTARIYVNTALQDIAAHSITSEAESKMSQACSLLRQKMARSKVPSLALLFFFLNTQ